MIGRDSEKTVRTAAGADRTIKPASLWTSIVVTRPAREHSAIDTIHSLLGAELSSSLSFVLANDWLCLMALAR